MRSMARGFSRRKKHSVKTLHSFEVSPGRPLKGGEGHAKHGEGVSHVPQAPAARFRTGTRSAHPRPPVVMGACRCRKGPPPKSGEAISAGRGRAAERMSFRACEEANDVELVRTTARGFRTQDTCTLCPDAAFGAIRPTRGSARLRRRRRSTFAPPPRCAGISPFEIRLDTVAEQAYNENRRAADRTAAASEHAFPCNWGRQPQKHSKLPERNRQLTFSFSR